MCREVERDENCQTHTFHTLTSADRPATERRVEIRKYSDNQIDFTQICAWCLLCTVEKFFISVQMAVDTKFRPPGSKMYTVQKHVCINCDGGNRSFTQLLMSRARWILLTVLKWILHFLSPVTFREAVTLKFPAFWQFKTNSHRPELRCWGGGLPGLSVLCVRVITRLYLSKSDGSHSESELHIS